MVDDSNKRGNWTLVWTTILFLPCVFIANFAAQTHINTVTVDNSTVSKRRVWFADFFRIIGNLMLGFRRAPVKVLSKDQWHQRETQLIHASVSDGNLILPILDGVPLSEFLANEDSVDRKFAAISAAAKALFDFHLQHNQSHGDASVSNVMVLECPDAEFSATWFDFDVAHKDSVPEIIRRADDLRALLFTAKTWLTDEGFALLFSDFGHSYTDEEVWQELIDSMSNPFQHCDIFHLSQIRRTKQQTSSNT